MTGLKIISAALDVVTLDGEERFAIRGVIDPHSVERILTPDYQREILSDKKVANLMAAMRRDPVPDVDLGMRGERFTERQGVFYLQDPVFVIDGLQRKTAAMRLVAMGEQPHLGALIHIGTCEDWERQRFEDLNLGQTNLSGNVILRNMAATSTVAALMHRLAQRDGKFVLKGLIAWQQNMRRGELISAITYYKTVGQAHAFFGPGRGTSVRELHSGMVKIMDNVGEARLRANIRTFFDAVDQAFGLRSIAYRNEAVVIKANFLLAVARMVAGHENFWEDNKLVFPDYVVHSLRDFPIGDPYIALCAGGNSSMVDAIVDKLVEHVNRGRRSNRLRPRNLDQHVFDDVDEDEDIDEDAPEEVA